MCIKTASVFSEAVFCCVNFLLTFFDLYDIIYLVKAIIISIWRYKFYGNDILFGGSGAVSHLFYDTLVYGA